MMNKFISAFILLGFSFVGLRAQTLNTNLYALPKDSNVLKVINNALIPDLSTKESAKLNYYGFLIADSLNLPQIKNEYILNLYELSSLKNPGSFETLIQKKIDKKYLTPKQSLRLHEIEFLQKQKSLKTDSLLIWLCDNYLNQNDTASEQFYAQKIIPILNSTLPNPKPSIIRAAIKLKNFYVAAQLLKDINPDSALGLVKTYTDSSLLSELTATEKNKWLLLAAQINYKLNNLKEADAIINSVDISEWDALHKADYYRTYTYLTLAQKRFAQMVKVSQLWLSNAFLISDINTKCIHFGQLKEFYWRAGNKKLAAALQDSINFYNMKNAERVNSNSVSFVKNEPDEFMAGILEAIKIFYQPQKIKNQSYFPEWYHWIFEAVLLIGMVLAIFLFKKRPKVIKEIVKETVEVEVIKEVERPVVSNIVVSDNVSESSGLQNILKEVQQNFKLNFQKTFKRSVFNAPNPNDTFVGFYDLRISKVATNRGIVIFIINSNENNSNSILRAYLRLNSLITEKGITQPSVLAKEIIPEVVQETHKSSGLVLFMNSLLNELTFCGTGINLQIKRNNKLHDLISKSATDGSQKSILQDNVLELNKEDILIVNKPDFKINAASVAEYIQSINVFEKTFIKEVEAENFVLGFKI